MPSGTGSVDVYVERGAKRAFAGAVEWPGWSRSGRDEDAALEALITYAPRFADALRGSRLGFHVPAGLTVVERLAGNATTDFGAIGVAPAADGRPVDAREQARLRRILQACWAALDRAVAAAEGRELRAGPRGGGRSLVGIVAHVSGADAGYLGRVAARSPSIDADDPFATLAEQRAVIVDALARAVTEGLPATGPRGGAIWPVRFFVRRSAWHVLDHAWEIEDRVEG